MEIGILRRILKRAKRWHFVEDEVRAFLRDGISGVPYNLRRS